MKPRKENVLVCPLCGDSIERIRNDPLNRWHCAREGCHLSANPMPGNVAETLGGMLQAVDWAAENAFWLGLLVGASVVAVLWLTW